MFGHKSCAVPCPCLQLMKYLLKIWEAYSKQAQILILVIKENICVLKTVTLSLPTLFVQGV
uniref:Uncharacterized protein n=2 Tax=Kuenenia stuttgartiensis TaxID=174633 RepID=Q1PVG4_KUEST|nr:unknown protein [Candidatus Kuenenia stuttgartiensis]